MYILGISCYYHDAAACIIKEGRVIAASNEERFTRLKHDSNFPYQSILFCLRSAGIKAEDLDYVVFYEKPFLKFERIIKAVLLNYPKSWQLFKEAIGVWLRYKLWIKATIADKFNIAENKILFSSHHLSHAASAFFCSPFQDAAILTTDGVGEWATTTFGIGRGNLSNNKNNIDIIKELVFPHSLGLLYSVFTAFLGFEVNNGEYKVMGLASFGKPIYKEKIYKLIDIKEDGSFRLNMKYFSYHYSITKAFNNNFVKLFGRPRKPKEGLNPATDEGKYYADIAASIQAVTEDILIKQANYLYSLTRLHNLCLAGGVALNCVANYKILEHTPFRNIYIQPNAGDGGGAVGAALYAYYALSKRERNYVMSNPYLGEEFSEKQIEDYLNNNINYEKFPPEVLVKEIAYSISQQKIVGWFQGRAEWGPRALGNRSILADPRRRDMKDILNYKVKFRESFRPFAPSVLYEYAEEIFDVSNIKDQHPFKFMLYSLPVKNNIIPAATHIDNTARPQFVKKEDNPLFYSLIEEFYKISGVPAILNTSFNLRGKPIVNSPEDAYNTFVRSGMDILVLGDYVITK